MPIGFLELSLVAPILLITLATPTATLVPSVRIYYKLNRIEEALTRDGS